MSDTGQPKEAGRLPPISSFDDPISQLLRVRLLDPPSRPGLLACLGKYEIFRVIGVGGMGLVCQGVDSECASSPGSSDTGMAGKEASSGGREVAIKLLRPEFVANAKAVELFLREAKTMRDLSHPNILPVLEVSQGTASGSHPRRPPPGSTLTVIKGERPYFVMPFVEGGSLASLIRSRGPLTDEVALSLGIQVASALAHVHEKGLIHRDLNPNNVLLSPGPCALVADFGLSRTILNDPSVDVRRPQTAGTKPYMSPAIVAGEAEDTRCDIYSFGALLYEMVTGCPPYHESSHVDLERCILAGPPKPAQLLNPKAGSGLVAIAEAAMARKLKDRYARMADVVIDLVRVQQGLPILGPFSRQDSSGGLTEKGSPSAPAFKRAWQITAGAFGGVAILASMGWTALHGSLKLTGHFQLPGVQNWGEARLADWEGDGSQEVVLLTGNDLTVVNHQGVVLRQHNPVGPNAANLGLDLVMRGPGSSGCRSFLHWDQGETAFVRELDNQLRSVRSLSVSKSELPAGASLRTAAAWQARDGTARLLAVASSPESSQILCFSDMDPSPKWSAVVQGQVVDAVALDWGPNGDPDIVCSIRTETPSKPGSNDACVRAWRSDGTDHWIVPLPAVPGKPRLAASPGSAFHPAVVLAWNEEEPWLLGSSNSVRRIASDGSTDAAFTLSVGMSDCRIIPAGRAWQCLATDRNGCIHLLDESLRLVRRQTVTERTADAVQLRAAAVDNLDARGGREMVITVAQVKVREPGSTRQAPLWTTIKNEVLVVGEDLKPRARTAASEARRSAGPITALVSDWEGDGASRILVLGDQALVLRYRPPFLERPLDKRSKAPRD